MNTFPEGNAIVYCEGAFNTSNGKTAHGLIRRTKRYRILSVIDSRYAGKDAGFVLDGKSNGISIYPDVKSAIDDTKSKKTDSSHLVIGLAPDGGRLNPRALEDIKSAIKNGLHVDCGLHDFLTDNKEVMSLAATHNVKIRDIRKTPPRHELHFFCGKIEDVSCFKIALLGTDSAVGKRTTAWVIVDALNEAGIAAELVGTGQTAWLQGVQYSIILDSLINDFVSGEIEHAVWSAWNEQHPDVIIIEGQGSLMNPAYPGGFEILAAGRPDIVILQHAPARKDYDGFPGYPLHPLEKQIAAMEMISGKPVVAITINHEGIAPEKIAEVCATIQKQTGLPTVDVLVHGARQIVNAIQSFLKTST